MMAKGVRTLHIAKRLIDYGFHPPTIYFPLVVREAMMIEPTETESKATLDKFCEAMESIAKEAIDHAGTGDQRAAHDGRWKSRRNESGEGFGSAVLRVRLSESYERRPEKARGAMRVVEPRIARISSPREDRRSGDSQTDLSYRSRRDCVVPTHSRRGGGSECLENARAGGTWRADRRE